MGIKQLCATIALLLVVSCSSADQAEDVAPVASTTTTTTVSTAPPTTEAAEMMLASPSFEDQSPIPTEHTCDGADASPQLNVSGLSSRVRSLVIIVDDPDAPLGTWDHWVEFDIDAGPGSFEFPRDAPTLGVSGNNSWRITGYMGPCPPEGEEHTYVFTVYALDTILGLPEGVDSEAVRTAMTDHILDSAVLHGTYSR